MLLDEDPATLISHTVSNFNIPRDKLALTHVSESLSTLNQARDLHIRSSTQSLKKLARHLSTLQTAHSELSSSHSSTAHASAISRLDTQKFRTAKAVSDLEMETERLGSTLYDLNARLQELELQGVEGDVAGQAASKDPLDDEVLLRLKVYRSLGIELEREGDGDDSRKDSSGKGEFTRAIVRNDRKGDVHVVNLDPKFSRFFYANYFWQTL
ncbi:hypothetical protein MKZ38_003205 [Zalerion maritima]|uniref:Kinetochore protein Spc24 n=1 Tax=Zalerion maritima TaxID=339359 RepID=A0AAD5WY97_9PEZI|nr:hypothetical protein MKZ38_003205 [Zalerion maritima]